MLIESIENFLVAPRRSRRPAGVRGAAAGTGRSPIELHWQQTTNSGVYRGGPFFGSAVAGLDQALWDIKGTELGVPVHELPGCSVRDGVRVDGTRRFSPGRLMLRAHERISNFC